MASPGTHRKSVGVVLVEAEYIIHIIHCQNRFNPNPPDPLPLLLPRLGPVLFL